MKPPFSFALTLGVTLLSGCVGPAILEKASLDYTRAYADTNNQQMLLNLARVSRDHPPYFVQLGAITAQYNLTTQLRGEQTRNTPEPAFLPGVSDLTSRVFSLGVSTAESPVFSFTPLSGQAFASVLLKPVDLNVFFLMYTQGFNAEQLLRILVNSVTVTTENGRIVQVTNIPDTDRLTRFNDFLRLASILRELQKQDALLIDLNIDTQRLRFDFTPEAAALFASLQQRPDLRLSMSPIRLDSLRGDNMQMRTFSAVLYAMGNEYKLFDEVAAQSPEILAALPPSGRRPILRFVSDGRLTSGVLTQVSYDGQSYVIADESGDNWNRQTFAILQFLFTQVALDPSQLPVQQLIQVR